jgi:biotin transport system permease protein
MSCVIVTGLYLLPGKAFAKHGFSQLRILWLFVVIVLIWHIWIAEILQGSIIVMRMLCAVALANLVTMTTRLSDMIDVIERLTRHLARLGLNPRVLELSIALVIRMTPVLLNKGHYLNCAWRARAKRRAGWRIILPFTLIALDDADHVAEAIRARGGLTYSEKK